MIHGHLTWRRRLFVSTSLVSRRLTATTAREARTLNYRQGLFLAAGSLATGICLGRWSLTTPPADHQHHQQHSQHLPDGQPRTCCETATTTSVSNLTKEQIELPAKLRKIVGDENVLEAHDVSSPRTAAYLKGARLGQAPALCIVTPRRLHHIVPVVQSVLDARATILTQGQNTGLTGGSVPRLDQPRPTVVLSMKYLNAIVPLDNGKRMICFAGTGLATLQTFLEKYFDRESHSTLGSTFLNPTTAAGVAFGSGGTQCRKGPAYTERALFLKITTDKWNEQIIQVVNTLDVDGLEDREERLKHNYRDPIDSVAYRLDTWGKYISQGDRDMYYSSDQCRRAASDTTYAQRLCELSQTNVNRSNADTHGPECCRCEGKVIVLATVHDTFPRPKATRTFWLSFDSLETAQQFREQVALNNPQDVPISMEYMNRDAYDIIDSSGRFMANCIHWTGMTSPLLRSMWNAKLYIEASYQPGIVDKALYRINGFLPSVLPKDIQQMAQEYDHHAAITIGEYGNGEMERFLDRTAKFIASQSKSTAGPPEKERIKIYECQTPSESSSLSAVRFVAAPAFRTWCVANDVSGFSVDYALPGKCRSIPNVPNKPLKRMRYSHFACNVVHEDIAYPIGEDVEEIKHSLKAAVEKECGGRLPAEHGHGTEYKAPPDAQQRWMKMDPLNVLNPGVGGLAKGFRYEK